MFAIVARKEAEVEGVVLWSLGVEGGRVSSQVNEIFCTVEMAAGRERISIDFSKPREVERIEVHLLLLLVEIVRSIVTPLTRVEDESIEGRDASEEVDSRSQGIDETDGSVHFEMLKIWRCS